MGWICLVISQSCSQCRQVQLKSMFSRHGSQMVSMTTVASLQTGTTNAHLRCSVKKVFRMEIFWEVSVFSQKVSGEFPWTQNTTVSFRFGTKGAQDLYFWCILGSLFCGACSFKLEYFVNLWSGGVWITLYKKIVCQCIWVICYIHACQGYVGKMRGCGDVMLCIKVFQNL